MNLDELFKLYGDDKETFIDKAEEAGFEPDEIWDYLYDDLVAALTLELVAEPTQEEETEE